MSNLNFDYVPLTFISDQEEIKRQIRNTLILIYLFEKYNRPVTMESLIEGTQYGYNASAQQSGKNKFLRISDIHESKVNWDTVPFCNCDDEETYLLNEEDILIARTGGTTGKSFKIDNPPEHAIYAGYLIRIRAKAEVNPDYLYLFLHSFAYWSQIVNLNERNFRPKANAENLKSLILPDCPKIIQDEVVKISEGEKVKGYEDLFAEIEKALNEYDKTQEVEKILADQLVQLENLNQAILQEAVQGKLVAQYPTDEPASELLKRIKAEKAKSTKKQKPLPPIKPGEIPFEIPESWVWCRLGEISVLKSGNQYDLPKSDNGVMYVKVGDMNLGGNDIEIKTSSNYFEKDAVKDQDLISIGSIIFPKRGGAIATNKRRAVLQEPILVDSNTMAVIPSKEMSFNYFLQWFTTIDLSKLGNDGVIPQVNNKDLNPILFPLPPVSEQKRIVAEIEKQLEKTKQLKTHILANQQATEQLLKALLHQAFEVEEVEEV